MGAVHTLVAEVLRELVYAFEATHNQTLEIQFVGNTQVQRYIEGVVVSDKGSSGSSTGYRLKDRSFHLDIARIVEILAHRAVNACALEEYLLYTVVDNKVNIAAAVTKLGIIESIVANTVFLLYDRQRTERLAKHSQRLGMYRNLACLGAEHIAGDTDKVADIKKLLEYDIV